MRFWRTWWDESKVFKQKKVGSCHSDSVQWQFFLWLRYKILVESHRTSFWAARRSATVVINLLWEYMKQTSLSFQNGIFGVLLIYLQTWQLNFSFLRLTYFHINQVPVFIDRFTVIVTRNASLPICYFMCFFACLLGFYFVFPWQHRYFRSLFGFWT